MNLAHQVHLVRSQQVDQLVKVEIDLAGGELGLFLLRQFRCWSLIDIMLSCAARNIVMAELGAGDAVDERVYSEEEHSVDVVKYVEV